MGRRNDDRLGIPLEDVRRLRAERRARLEANRRKWAASPSEPVTFAMARAGHEWLWAYCLNPLCGHCAALPLAPLIIRWGRDAPIDHLRRFARCSRCGHKGADLRTPSWSGSDRGWAPVNEFRRWTGKEVVAGPELDVYAEDWASGHDGKILWHLHLGAVEVERMCNLYSNTRSRDATRALFRISDNRAVAIERQPAIFPRSVAPVVRRAEDGERELVHMTWGFPLLRKGYAPQPVTNVRDDKLDSMFWRSSFGSRRCLVPASSYCEPDSRSPAGWHWFALEPADERPLFAFAGIWRRYSGPMKKNGPSIDVDVYAFLTTSPNVLTATIMHDRMPVLLSGGDEFETWLSGSDGEARQLIRTFDADRMRIVQSGKEKRDLVGAAI